MSNDDFPSIDPEMLAVVTGGTTDSTDQITMMLQELMSSIKDLSNANNNTSNSFMQMLPIIMMMRNRSAPAPVAAPAPVLPPGDGWIKVT